MRNSFPRFVLMSLAFCIVASVAPAAEESIIQFRRLDKAILVPSGEMGEIDVSAWAQPTSATSTRYRYTYEVIYREGFPSIYPFSEMPSEDSVPAAGVALVGDPDCDFAAVATPGRHDDGPWSWHSPLPGVLTYATESRRWRPGDPALRFTFTSACAPGRGTIFVTLTHDESVTDDDYTIAAGILTPMRPPVRPRAERPGDGRPGRRGTYASPSRRR